MSKPFNKQDDKEAENGRILKQPKLSNFFKPTPAAESKSTSPPARATLTSSTAATSTSSKSNEIVHNESALQFEISLKDMLPPSNRYSASHWLACLQYNWINKTTMDMIHTYTPDAFQGMGIASLLCEAAFEYCQRNDVRVVPSCTFILNKYLKQEGSRFLKICVPTPMSATSSESEIHASSSSSSKAVSRTCQEQPQNPHHHHHQDHQDHHHHQQQQKQQQLQQQHQQQPPQRRQVQQQSQPRIALPFHKHYAARWDNACRILKSASVRTPQQLVQMMTAIAETTSQRARFSNLIFFFGKFFSKNESEDFFERVLPFMCSLVLRTPTEFRVRSVININTSTDSRNMQDAMSDMNADADTNTNVDTYGGGEEWEQCYSIPALSAFSEPDNYNGHDKDNQNDKDNDKDKGNDESGTSDSMDNSNDSVHVRVCELTRRQVLCLLACSFFSLLPSVHQSFPHCNMNSMIESISRPGQSSVLIQ
jgi:predicted GNAT family acetyltransferase